VTVALDGYSGAGKSIVAARLAALVDAAMVHVDVFYADLPDPVRWRLTPAKAVEQYVDWTRLRDEALIPPCHGHAVSYGTFGWATGAGLSDLCCVSARPVVFVEGVYSTRPQQSTTSTWLSSSTPPPLSETIAPANTAAGGITDGAIAGTPPRRCTSTPSDRPTRSPRAVHRRRIVRGRTPTRPGRAGTASTRTRERSAWLGSWCGRPRRPCAVAGIARPLREARPSQPGCSYCLDGRTPEPPVQIVTATRPLNGPGIVSLA
jgi:hypothetical protein